MSYRIDEIPNRGHPPTILLRRHWREGKRVRKETVANLTRHPGWLAEGIRSLLKTGPGRAELGGASRLLEPYEGYLADKIGNCPDLSGRRLFREK